MLLQVFPTRKRSEHQATCYNCGHLGHYGDECTEQTMESMTYSRYCKFKTNNYSREISQFLKFSMYQDL